MEVSPISQFESDKDLAKVLTNNFGNIIVLIFFAEWNAQSKQFVHHLNKSIPIFGLFENVRYFALSAERCPETFKKF